MKRINFYICQNDTIQEIQASFSHFYPSLEIKFFSNSEKNQAVFSCVMFSPEVRIRDISPDCQDGSIELTDHMTINELEKSISDRFKLHAEVSKGTEKRSVGVPFPETNHPVYFKNIPFGC
jgi:hypothetical protein